MPFKRRQTHQFDPKSYFFDFLRGYFDGDGCSYSYYDQVWPNSYRFYISFASGSEKYFHWLRAKLAVYAKIKGSISRKSGTTNVQLKFAKREAEIIAKKMYYQENLVCLERKRLKVFNSLNEMNSRRSGEIGRRAAFRTLWAHALGGSSPPSDTSFPSTEWITTIYLSSCEDRYLIAHYQGL